MSDATDSDVVVGRVLRWYGRHARDLPWRRADASAWQVMVSEFMLQQTPVARVLGPWTEWVERWPTPEALAAAPVGEAVRAWGCLGYPRRALRLHRAATVIVEEFDGRVPGSYAELIGLPGVGPYTAAAIATFAFGHRHVVLDTNVRRVLGRLGGGIAHPGPATTAADVALATAFLPASPRRAARWAVASMELGALVCTARSPRCQDCPVRSTCAWYRAGRPVRTGPPRKAQPYAGTDRQCRGALLAALRSSDIPIPAGDLDTTWPTGDQRERALQSLLDDGLAVAVGAAGYALPMTSPATRGHPR